MAEFHGWEGYGHIGKPIPRMVKRVQQWIREGRTVKIMTARVASHSSCREQTRITIQEWCEEHIGVKLEVTSEKDYNMVELWDDRAITVEKNTGVVLTRYYTEDEERAN